MSTPEENFDGVKTDPYSYVDSTETPATARERVARAGNRLVQAELGLKRARDMEVACEIEYDKNRRRALLSRDCPKVGRGEGFVTVAEQTAWVEDRVADDAQRMKLAEVARQAAFDHYRRVDTQSMLAQSILKSIDRAFGMGTRDNA